MLLKAGAEPQIKERSKAQGRRGVTTDLICNTIITNLIVLQNHQYKILVLVVFTKLIHYFKIYLDLVVFKIFIPPSGTKYDKQFCV